MDPPRGFAPRSPGYKAGALLIELRRNWEMVTRPGAAPGISSAQTRRIAVFLARDMKNGGLCGHCSRDLPLDRRLLFIAELTGQVGNGGLCR